MVTSSMILTMKEQRVDGIRGLRFFSERHALRGQEFHLAGGIDIDTCLVSRKYVCRGIFAYVYASFRSLNISGGAADGYVIIGVFLLCALTMPYMHYLQ